jgi:hypothetical protein
MDPLATVWLLSSRLRRGPCSALARRAGSMAEGLARGGSAAWFPKLALTRVSGAIRAMSSAAGSERTALFGRKFAD